MSSFHYLDPKPDTHTGRGGLCVSCRCTRVGERVCIRDEQVRLAAKAEYPEKSAS